MCQVRRSLEYLETPSIQFQGQRLDLITIEYLDQKIDAQIIPEMLRILEHFLEIYKPTEDGAIGYIEGQFYRLWNVLYGPDPFVEPTLIAPQEEPETPPQIESLPIQYKRQPIPPELRRAVYERDDYKCRHCGERFNISCDHVVPVSKGGPTTYDNLQVLCMPCNLKKGARTVAQSAGPSNGQA